MKVFVRLKVPREDTELEQLANLTRDGICQTGHEPFVAPYQIADQGLINSKDFMPIVGRQVAASDLMIVYDHPELCGGLIELGLAYAKSIPIWLGYKSGQRI